MIDVDKGRRWNQLRPDSLPKFSAVAGFRLSRSDAVVLHPNYPVSRRDYISGESCDRRGGVVGDPVPVRGDGRRLVCDKVAVGVGIASLRIRVLLVLSGVLFRFNRANGEDSSLVVMVIGAGEY